MSNQTETFPSLRDRLLAAVGDTTYEDERAGNPEIKEATRNYVHELCEVIPSVMPWSERPQHFWDDYEEWTEWLVDRIVECVARNKFSDNNIRINTDSFGRTNIDDLIDTEVWEEAVVR
jgi:hypothetical protein